jgi:hypothetical protein
VEAKFSALFYKGGLLMNYIHFLSDTVF